MDVKEKPLFEIDSKTYEDLDIIVNNDAFSLFTLITERASTTDSKEIIKTMLQSPMRDISQIVTRQKEIEFIIKSIDKFQYLRLNDTILYISRDYLNSNIIVSKPNMIYTIFSVYRYRIFLPELTKGINGFQCLVSQFQLLQFEEKLIPLKLKNIISDIVRFFDTLKNNNISKYISKKPLTDMDILHIDGVLRGDMLECAKKMIQAVINLDAYIAIAKFHIEFALTFPVFNGKMEDDIIEIKDLRHMAIRNCKPYSI